MAKKTVSELTEKTNITGSDVLLIEDSIATYKVTRDNLVKGLATETGVAGVKSELQTELAKKAVKTEVETALSGKANSTHTHAIGDVTGLESTLAQKAVKTEVETALSGKSDTGHTHDAYALKTELPDVSGLATLTTEVTAARGGEESLDARLDAMQTAINTATGKDMSGFVTDDELAAKNYLTSIPDEYVTTTELNGMNYVTTDAMNSALGAKANSSALAAVATTGSYKNLKDTPTIPTVDVTKSYVDTELAKKMNTVTLATVATTGSYNDLADKPKVTNGTNGVGISKVEQTTTSTEDGGSNVITVTLTNDATSTFTVKNGSKGSQGQKGDSGANGQTPNITIGTVTTGAAGSDATAKITGTTPNLVLDLTIPQGAKGEQGPAGSDADATALESRIKALEDELSAATGENKTLKEVLSALEARIAALENLSE